MLTRLRESFDKQRDSATHKKSCQGATEEQPQKVREKQACNNEVWKDEDEESSDYTDEDESIFKRQKASSCRSNRGLRRSVHSTLYFKDII